MAGKTIIDIRKPVTQSIEAVKALLAWRGRAADPLPSFVELAGGARLTKSRKGDCYYTTTRAECSCPARNWHPNQPCKHMKALDASLAIQESREKARAYQARQRGLKGTAPTIDSIMPRKSFKPFLEDELRPAKAALPSPLVDCLEEPTARDLAYHSIKADRDMWPMVEA